MVHWLPYAGPPSGAGAGGRTVGRRERAPIGAPGPSAGRSPPMVGRGAPQTLNPAMEGTTPPSYELSAIQKAWVVDPTTRMTGSMTKPRGDGESTPLCTPRVFRVSSGQALLNHDVGGKSFYERLANRIRDMALLMFMRWISRIQPVSGILFISKKRPLFFQICGIVS